MRWRLLGKRNRCEWAEEAPENQCPHKATTELVVIMPPDIVERLQFCAPHKHEAEMVINTLAKGD